MIQSYIHINKYMYKYIFKWLWHNAKLVTRNQSQKKWYPAQKYIHVKNKIKVLNKIKGLEYGSTSCDFLYINNYVKKLLTIYNLSNLIG